MLKTMISNRLNLSSNLHSLSHSETLAENTEISGVDKNDGFSLIEVILVVIIMMILSGVGFYWMLEGAGNTEDHVRETSELISENHKVSEDFSYAVRNAVAIDVSSGASFGKLMIEDSDEQCRTWLSVESSSSYGYLSYFEGDKAKTINDTSNSNSNTAIRNAIEAENTESDYYPDEYYSDYAPAEWGRHFQVLNNEVQNGILLNFVDYVDREPVMTHAVKPRTMISEESDCW